MAVIPIGRLAWVLGFALFAGVIVLEWWEEFMFKPIPHEHVYDWIPGTPSAESAKHDVNGWLRAVAPTVSREFAAVVRGWDTPNGSLHFVALDDHARGWCGDALSAESIAFLTENLARNFWLRVWW